MEFYTLNNSTEDKIISRQQRIFADTAVMGEGVEMTVNTKSIAPRLKIKFFLDVMRYYDETTDPVTDMFYRVGKYIELEPTEIAQHFYSKGFIWFTYSCSENDGNGSFTFSLTPHDSRYTLYLSSIVFEDSFYNPNGGWLNPSNPDNLIDVLQVEEILGGQRMDLAYCNASIRNVSVAEKPYLTFYTAYEDDFISIGWYKIAAASTQLIIIPKNIHRVKAQEDGTYLGSGTFNIELLLASSTVPNGVTNLPVSLTETFTTALSIPDEIGFNITCAVGYIKGAVFWQAVDGYTYGIKIMGNVYNIAAAASIDLQVLYLGRNPTGYSPVPEN